MVNWLSANRKKTSLPLYSDVGLLGGAIPLGKAALAPAQVVRKLDTLK